LSSVELLGVEIEICGGVPWKKASPRRVANGALCDFR